MFDIRKIFSIGMTLLFVISMLGQCFAAVGVQVQGAQATFDGLRQVVQGAPNTFVMTDGAGWYLLAWPQAGKWGWTIIGPQGVDLNALKIDATNLAKTANDLAANGWKYITAKELPQKVISSCLLYSATAGLFAITTLPSIIIFPAVLLQFIFPPEMNPYATPIIG